MTISGWDLAAKTGFKVAYSLISDQCKRYFKSRKINNIVEETYRMAENDCDAYGSIFILTHRREVFRKEIFNLSTNQTADLDAMINDACAFYNDILSGREKSLEPHKKHFHPHQVYLRLRKFSHLLCSNIANKFSELGTQPIAIDLFDRAVKTFPWNDINFLLDNCKDIDIQSQTKKDPEEFHSPLTNALETNHAYNIWNTNEKDNPFHTILPPLNCAWIIQWYPNPRTIDTVQLTYNTNKVYGEPNGNDLDPRIRGILFDFQKKYPEQYERLNNEPFGYQTRINSIGVDSQINSVVNLSPTKYLYYKFIQAALAMPEYHGIRESFIPETLENLAVGENVLLPNQFALHMAIISEDNKLFLRQRRGLNYTTLYPQAWEVGIGEFMHGPKIREYAHFDSTQNPSLSLYLKQAVAEEIGYFGAKDEDFNIYGFAVEYLTLAPKMLVVYKSDLSIDQIEEGGLYSKDSARNVDSVDLSIEGVASLIKTNDKYQYWGPTSRLVAILALMQCITRNHKIKNGTIDKIYKLINQ